MSDWLSTGPRRRRCGGVAALLLALAVVPSVVWGQAPPAAPSAFPTLMPPGPEAAPPPAPKVPTADPAVKQAGCQSCGSGGLWALAHGGGCSSCGSGCIPGRKPCCCPCDSKTALGRFVNGVCECLCCPDPCYEGLWCPLQDAAFFADAPRPITQMRLRFDNVWDFTFPDRAEYVWAAQRAAAGAAPVVPAPAVPGARVSTPKGPAPPQREIDYYQVSLYTEVAVGRFSAFIEMPYREVNSIGGVTDFSGFGDLSFGTKSLLLDCPLGQLGFQFKVFTPTGQASHGLGTGHVSLEPSLLLGLRLAPDTYLQTQWAYWIPIAGDQIFAGDIFHYHVSLNQVLWRPLSRVEFIGTLEFNGFSVLDGAFSNPAIVGGNGQPIPQPARTHICSLGPGLRCFICDVIDFGAGSAWALTDANFGDEWVRAEFRLRF
jgi:hypothetical protein